MTTGSPARRARLEKTFTARTPGNSIFNRR
jgi:hypothetical protein